MMTVNIHRTVKSCFALLCLAIFSLSANALSLGEAKANGLVGEHANGYIGAVGAPNGEVQTLINQINVERRALYQQIANETGTDINTVASLAGQKAINRTPGGQYVNYGSGWFKK